MSCRKRCKREIFKFAQYLFRLVTGTLSTGKVDVLVQRWGWWLRWGGSFSFGQSSDRSNYRGNFLTTVTAQRARRNLIPISWRAPGHPCLQ
ncbi:unnamed protein product [Tetraodon nigroviridis]|uniref:(spotted green pufferfish) hypothetical protein n=1 Tax=Tetraodon nigroviridis TaxID=99883 RepID=Q4SAN2_TETNG|nr:unnamed protein product [Tetraodon nigroviridis]